MSSKQKSGKTVLSKKSDKILRESKTYKCEDCGYEAIGNRDLENHVATTECYAVICAICGMKFRRASNLYVHKKKVHDAITEDPDPTREPSRKRFNQSYECADCGFKTEYQYQFEHHIFSNPQCKAYKCEICGVGIRRKNSLRVHMKNHTGAKEFSCKHCDMTFRTTSHRKTHEAVHEGTMKYSCEFCSRRFVQSSSYMTHMNAFHPTEQTKTADNVFDKFICDLCGRGLKTETALEGHLSKHKWGSKLDFCCQYCDRGFNSKHQLTNHIHDYHKDKAREAVNAGTIGARKITRLALHQNNKHSKCKKCNKRYRHKPDLIKHLQRHHEDYFKEGCPFCPETFESAEQFYKHYYKMHTEDLVFQCQFCTEKFSTKNSVLRHEVLHTGTKSVECPVCNMFLSSIHYNRGRHKDNCKLVDGVVTRIVTIERPARQNIVLV